VIRHLLVIGAQRCGTTYLHTMLDSHEQITMARPANPEPKVFCSDEATGRGAEWYRETYFAHAGDELLLGEKSTSYLEDPNAPARAKGMLGEIHVLAILRDPVKRAISNWRFSTDNGLETRSLETALKENLAGPREWDPSRTSVSPFAYVERGRYVDYLDPWMSTFRPVGRTPAAKEPSTRIRKKRAEPFLTRRTTWSCCQPEKRIRWPRK